MNLRSGIIDHLFNFFFESIAVERRKVIIGVKQNVTTSKVKRKMYLFIVTVVLCGNFPITNDNCSIAYVTEPERQKPRICVH